MPGKRDASSNLKPKAHDALKSSTDSVSIQKPNVQVACKSTKETVEKSTVSSTLVNTTGKRDATSNLKPKPHDALKSSTEKQDSVSIQKPNVQVACKSTKETVEKSTVSSTLVNTTEGWKSEDTQEKRETEKTQGCNVDNKDPIIGYIHNVSVLKESRNKFKYFNFNIQTENDYLQGVCYEPHLHRDICSKKEVQRPIKLSNYSLKENNLKKDSFSIVINRRAKVEYFDECHFQYKEPEQNSAIKISDIEKVADFECITTVGKVHVSSAAKRVKLNDNKPLLKLECKIADSSAAIRLTVWEKNIENIENDKFYKVTNARVRTYYGEKYLSVGSDTILTEITSDSDTLPVVDALYSTTEVDEQKTIEIDGFLGVQMISRYAKCKNGNCNKRLNNMQSKFHLCQMCGLRQIITEADKCHLSITVLEKENNLSLRLNDQEAEDAIHIYNQQPDVTTKIDAKKSSESDITEALLVLGPIKVTYNSSTKLITQVSPL